MKYTLRSISPIPLAGFLAIFGFLLSIFTAIMAMISIHPGATVTLTGFITFQFTDRIDIWMLVLHPFANAIGGAISGLIIASLYNCLARLTGGISITLSSKTRD